MSAINTAAIGSPAGGHHLLAGSGHRNFSPELDEYPNHRQPRHNRVSPTIGSSQMALAASDSVWDQNRDISTVGGLPFTHLYGQPYQSSAFDMRQMAQYPMSQHGHLTAGTPPLFGNPNYNASSLHHTSSFVSQSESQTAGVPERHGPANWNQTFQGLSLGR